MLPTLSYLAATSIDCASEQKRKLLGIFPKWYERLPYGFDSVTHQCEIQIKNFTDNPGQLWLIALTILDILLRIGGLVAVGFVIYGGFRYISSQGEPENTRAALSTIINALVGVGITVIASTAVAFIANRLGG